MDSNRFSLGAIGGTALVMNNNASLVAPVDKGPDKDKWEREHFLEKVYRTPSGALCIPSAAWRKAFINACKFVDAKPKGTGFKSFAPLVEAALVIEEDALLGCEDSALIPWTTVVNLDPSKGPRGPRGPRTRPLLPVKWFAATNARVFDARLSLDILKRIAEKAGWMCGLLDARAIGMGRCDIEVLAL